MSILSVGHTRKRTTATFTSTSPTSVLTQYWGQKYKHKYVSNLKLHVFWVADLFLDSQCPECSPGLLKSLNYFAHTNF
uniref:Uncharacterized protein n=1 Tax=Anguilla anguilla TaxID=7936 RepID=A0A0E9Q9R0_ANGAN